MPNSVLVRKDSPDHPPSPVVPRLPRARPAEPSDDRISFFRAFLREPLTVGAFLPSSSALARQVVDGCELHSKRSVVELGPGTGAITRLVLKQLNPKARFFALELSAGNTRELKRRFPRLDVYGDSAEHLPTYLARRGQAKVDCVISGLAWGNMLPSTQDPLMNAVLTSLAPGGLFTTFAYVHALWFPTTLRFRRWLFREFRTVRTSPIIWKNVPPAFVYRCRR